ncbi:hypothetical protein D9M69_184870 [compost metagenome]
MFSEGLAIAAPHRGLQRQQPGRFQPRAHVREHPLQTLLARQRLTAHLALPGPVDRARQRRFADAKAGGGHVQAAVVQHLHRGAEAAAFRPQPVGGRDEAVQRHLVRRRAADAHQFLGGRDLHAGAVPVHHEGADAARAGRGIGLGVDDDKVGCIGVGDEMLDAAQAVAVAFRRGARGHVGGVGAGARLGQRERAQLAAGGVRQVAFTQAVVAADQDGVGGQVVRADHRRGRSAGLRDFGQRQDQRDRRGPGAAPAFRQVHAHQAEFGKLRHVARGGGFGAVHFGGVRRQFALREAADRVGDLQVFRFDAHSLMHAASPY